jgi:DNA-binding NarL/FixJ family response regulator
VANWVALSRSQSSILVVDPVGSVFSSLRDLGLSASLWRVVDRKRIPALSGIDLAVYAVYGRVDWATADDLAERAPTVIITTVSAREDATEALSHGLVGYLDLALNPDAMRRALAGVLSGEPAYSRDVTGAWLRARRAAAVGASRDIGLTPRQRQIVALIARGATDKEIASVLGIATATAQKHVTNILERLHVPNRAAAVAAVSARLAS